MQQKGWIAELRKTFGLLRNLRRNPNVGQDLKRSRLFRAVTSVFPPKFLRHYVYPRMVGRSASEYDAARFFDSFYTASEGDGVTDAGTVSPTEDALTSRYHYAVTEKALIECLVRHEVPTGGSLLDVGSGAGHWIDLYRALLRPTRVVGLDISATAATALGRRMAAFPEVEIRHGDVAEPGFELGQTFALINAIGVLFHIVDDEAWARALANLARHLEPGGHLIVGGQFGWITASVQFHGTDEFTDWAEGAGGGARLVNKRIRSLRRWKREARRAGLRFVAVHRTKEVRSIYTPENNVLLLRKPT